MPHATHSVPRRKSRDYSRRREALVGVRLSPDELAIVKAVAERDGLTLPAALREGFLRHAAADTG
jgi:hypothetical protein